MRVEALAIIYLTSGLLRNAKCWTHDASKLGQGDSPPPGPSSHGGNFTALGLGTLLLVTALEIVKNKKVLHEFMLHTSRPVPKTYSNTVVCITFSTMLVIWH